jgi:hypothetical protein
VWYTLGPICGPHAEILSRPLLIHPSIHPSIFYRKCHLTEKISTENLVVYFMQNKTCLVLIISSTPPGAMGKQKSKTQFLTQVKRKLQLRLYLKIIELFFKSAFLELF